MNQCMGPSCVADAIIRVIKDAEPFEVCLGCYALRRELFPKSTFQFRVLG